MSYNVFLNDIMFIQKQDITTAARAICDVLTSNPLNNYHVKFVDKKDKYQPSEFRIKKIN